MAKTITDPSGLGIDFLGSNLLTGGYSSLDLNSSLSVSTGKKALAEALARRLMTPPGGLFYDTDYGLDVRQYINDSIVNTLSIAAAVEAECLKEERVDSVSADVSFSASSQTLTIKISVVAVNAETFDFTLNVSQVSFQLLLGNT